MVRKIIVFMLMLALIAAMPLCASAATLYDGTISSSALQYARDIVSKAPPLSNYVFWRSDQYEHILAFGELVEASGVFTMHDCTFVYIFQATGDSYGSSHYEVSWIDNSSDTLITDGYLVYSNLGNYPELMGDQHYALLTLFLMLIVCCSLLLRPIFNFVCRKRY